LYHFLTTREFLIHYGINPSSIQKLRAKHKMNFNRRLFYGNSWNPFRSFFSNKKNCSPWEIRNSSANKDIFCVLWNNKLHFCIQNSQTCSLSWARYIKSTLSSTVSLRSISYYPPVYVEYKVFKEAFFLVSPSKFILHFCSVPYLPHTPTISSYVIRSSSSISSSSSAAAAAAAAVKVPQYKPVPGLFCLALVSPYPPLSTYIHFSGRSVFIH